MVVRFLLARQGEGTRALTATNCDGQPPHGAAPRAPPLRAFARQMLIAGVSPRSTSPITEDRYGGGTWVASFQSERHLCGCCRWDRFGALHGGLMAPMRFHPLDGSVIQALMAA